METAKKNNQTVTQADLQAVTDIVKEKIWSDDDFCDHVYYLKARWADEGQFEDFGDYRKSIVDRLGFDVKVTKHFTISFEKRGCKAEVKFGAGGNMKYKVTPVDKKKKPAQKKSK